MNHEKRFMIDLERLAWNCARERLRSSRDSLFILVVSGDPKVVSRKGTKVFARAPGADMADVVYYDGQEQACEAADGLAKARGNRSVDLVAVPAYEYAKAREYSCRMALAEH